MTSLFKKIKTGGRKKYKGCCSKCGTSESSRWFHKYCKEGTVCRPCYQKERLGDSVTLHKRGLQRKNWSIKSPYKQAIKLAKDKNMEFSLTESEYMEKIKECFYCGANLMMYTYGIKLDRLDSQKHYTSENTVGCCKICNIAKNKNSL